MDFQELNNIVFNSGIVGAGGAGFPTHAKLNIKADTIILNCAECEPLLRVDRQLLIVYTDEIFEALSLVVEALNIQKCIIAVKSAYINTINAVKEKIGNYKKLELKIIPDVYPAGDEVVLIYETTGKVVPEGSIPISVGAVVLNVETALNIYKAWKINRNVTNKYVTITGEVKKKVTVKVAVGTAISELINFAGGTTIDDYEIIMGGPMTGRLVNLNDVVTKTTKAIIILPKDHPVILRRHQNLATNLKRARSVCSQCQMCSDLCPRALIGHSIKPNRVMNALSNNLVQDINSFTMAMYCSQCGLCEVYSCHQGLSPKTLIGELKGKLAKNGIRPVIHESGPVNPLRSGRQVPMGRLISRLGLIKYNEDAPVDDSIKILPKKAKILLSQGIGAASIPVVCVGKSVKIDDLIADVPEGRLGSKIHASINGIVTEVTDKSISIESRGDNNE